MVTMKSYHRSASIVSCAYFLAVAIILLALAPTNVHAKIQSGKIHLSGAKTESTVVKFAVSSKSSAKIDLNITSYGMYEDEKELRLRIYVDEEWPKVRKEPLCSEKIRMAQRSVPIVMEYRGSEVDDRKGKKKGGRGDRAEMYSARIRHEVTNPPNPRQLPERKDRSRYFYFVIDDCNLERAYHDKGVPDMLYTVSIQNGRPSPGGGRDYDHLPSDEEGIGKLLVLTILISGGLALLLLYKMASTIGGEVHVAIFIVVVACLTNGLSALCELIHLSVFSKDGHGIYALDAFSSHFEALSDSMVSLILLSIGGGWTLPSDVVGGGIGKEASSNKFLRGVRNPAGSLLDLISSGGGSGDKKGGIVALAIILVHAGLAQWGRTFDDDFDTYHALEHPPGRALMMLRFALGLFFITGVGMVRSGGRCPPSLMSFLTKFGLVGLSYFASLPGVSMFVGSVLPYYQRHQALHWGASMVQFCSLASLTWLFIGGHDASAYHRLSRVGNNEKDMTESIASSDNVARPSMWRMGKTKIRLD